MRTKHIEKSDELRLVNLANNMIGKCGLSEGNAYIIEDPSGEIRTPYSWHMMLTGEDSQIIRREIARMNLKTLGTFVAFGITGKSSQSLYRRTGIEQFMKRPKDINCDLFHLFDFDQIPCVIKGDFAGLRILRYLAELVIVGMMYDIIMARKRFMLGHKAFAGNISSAEIDLLRKFERAKYTPPKKLAEMIMRVDGPLSRNAI